MSMEDSEEMMRCDKEGYFDLDSLKPYSSVWVSTRRDARTKSHSQDEDSETKKNVMPSRACNNLHSLLETTEGFHSNDTSEEEVKTQALPVLPSTKSDHFPLNPYKLFSNDGVSMRKISDKIIESMCKSDSKVLFNEAESTLHCSSSSKRLIAVSMSKERNISEKSFQMQHDQEAAHEERKTEPSEGGEAEEIGCSAFKKFLRKSDEDPKERINREPSKSSYLGSGEPQEDASKGKLLSDHGKLITEMSLATMTLRDQSGREFPVQVKYVWETDPNEVTKAPENVFNTSPALMKILESVSSVGMKCDSWYSNSTTSGLGAKTISWHERTKSMSSCGQLKNKRIEEWNAEEKNPNVSSHFGSKGDVPAAKKGLFKDSQSVKSAVLRSKVSVVGSEQDKKSFEHTNEYRKDAKTNETKPNEHSTKEGSRVNIADRKATHQRNYRIPVKKKLGTVDEMRSTGALSLRPSTFNKREPAPRPAPNRPPSAPTREMTSRIPQRLGLQETGDKLSAVCNKRQFGFKLQTPPTPGVSRFWK